MTFLRVTMSNDNSWLTTLRRRYALTLSRPPVDLSVTAVTAALLGIVVAVNADPGWGLRASLTLVTLAMLPGYVLVAIVYPWNHEHRRDAFQPSHSERVALAFGTSAALLPLLSLIPALLGLEYTPLTALVAIESSLAVGLPIAVYRRKGVQRSAQFRLPLSDWVVGLSEWIRSTSYPRRVLRGVLVMSVLVAVVSFGYALTAPQDGERYSTMTLLSENESGDLVAADYPTTVTAREPTELTVAIENERRRETTYTVVVRLERLGEGDTQRITEAERLAGFRQTVARNATWTRQHRIAPTITGENLRLRYYLYVGEPPESVGPETARDYLHIWVDATPA